MANHKPNETIADRIKQAKIAINQRKYAHVDEINLLWNDAVKSSMSLNWFQVMLFFVVICVVIAFFA